MLKLSFIVMLFAVVAASIAAPPKSRTETANVSLISLIANPTKYDGKYIRILGVAYFDGPHYINAIYLTREDKRKANSSNSIFVEFAPSIGNEDRLNDKFVLAQGIFRASYHGHAGVFPSSITDVDRVEAVEGVVR